MGVDLAKVQDYTVIAIYDRADNHQVYQDRFQTLEWPFQKKRIIEMARLYNNALTVLDATGLGDPIADDLLRENVAVEPFKFTNESKKEAVEKLSIWIEQNKMAFINMEETLLEFDNYSYDITSSGRIIYNAREGYHDDIVMAHALAVWGLTPVIREERIEEVPLIRQELRRRINSTYGGLHDDSDLIAV
jgi:phage FluMu gp28-like protein